MGMTKTINTFKKLEEIDDVDLKYAVETLHGMYHSALGGKISPSEINKRLTDWEIREKVRPEYQEDFNFLVNSTKTLAFQNG